MNKKLRKQQNILVNAGNGVILFAVWSVARVNLYLGLSKISVEELYTAAEELGINNKYFYIFLATVAACVLLWQLSIRLYIGLSAIAEGKGKEKSWLYLVIAAILLIINIRSNWQIFGVDRVLAGEAISVNLVTDICMESASAYVLLELLISGIRVKMLRKKMKE